MSTEIPETDPDKAPTNTYVAADWIVKRHPWAREMAERVVGPLGDVDSNHDWLSNLAQAVLDHATHIEEWAAYESRHPAPQWQDDEEAAGRKYDAWLNAGPEPTPGAAAFGPMSSGEKRIVRLLATLANMGVHWSVTEIGFDERGARILLDWMAVCRAQLPEELYDPNYDPEAKWREFVARREAETVARGEAGEL